MSTQPQPIIFCYDGSESSKHATAFAANTLARRPGMVLCVWREPMVALTDSFSDPKSGGPSLATLERSATARAMEIVEQGKRIATAFGWNLETHVEPSSDGVGETIVRFARALNAELVVLGTHGRTTAQRDLLGSVSRVVLGACPRPVLVVPRDA